MATIHPKQLRAWRRLLISLALGLFAAVPMSAGWAAEPIYVGPLKSTPKLEMSQASGPLGLCQCISDVKRLNFSCRDSADACQAECGSAFAFSPQVHCDASAGQPAAQ